MNIDRLHKGFGSGIVLLCIFFIGCSDSILTESELDLDTEEEFDDPVYGKKPLDCNALEDLEQAIRCMRTQYERGSKDRRMWTSAFRANRCRGNLTAHEARARFESTGDPIWERVATKIMLCNASVSMAYVVPHSKAPDPVINITNDHTAIVTEGEDLGTRLQAKISVEFLSTDPDPGTVRVKLGGISDLLDLGLEVITLGADYTATQRTAFASCLSAKDCVILNPVEYDVESILVRNGLFQRAEITIALFGSTVDDNIVQHTSYHLANLSVLQVNGANVPTQPSQFQLTVLIRNEDIATVRLLDVERTSSQMRVLVGLGRPVIDNLTLSIGYSGRYLLGDLGWTSSTSSSSTATIAATATNDRYWSTWVDVGPDCGPAHRENSNVWINSVTTTSVAPEFIVLPQRGEGNHLNPCE